MKVKRRFVLLAVITKLPMSIMASRVADILDVRNQTKEFYAIQQIISNALIVKCLSHKT